MWVLLPTDSENRPLISHFAADTFSIRADLFLDMDFSTKLRGLRYLSAFLRSKLMRVRAHDRINETSRVSRTLKYTCACLRCPFD